MAGDAPSPAARLARRRFLGALALAPAALAGCGGSAAARGPGDEARSTRPRVAAPPDGAIRAVRDFPLPPGAEPAFVFVAATTRPGEP